MNLIPIIVIVIYLFSLVMTWNFIRLAHSKDGRWSNINPDFSDVFFTLFITNLLWPILYLIGWKREGMDYSKLFKVKK